MRHESSWQCGRREARLPSAASSQASGSGDALQGRHFAATLCRDALCAGAQSVKHTTSERA